MKLLKSPFWQKFSNVKISQYTVGTSGRNTSLYEFSVNQPLDMPLKKGKMLVETIGVYVQMRESISVN